jgi:hypothetical protein
MAVNEPIHNHRDAEDRVVLNATEARQGRPGRPVLYVLVIGLFLAMLAWAAAEFWGMAIDTQTPSDKTQVTTPATEPASENENVVNDDPAPGDKRQTEPVLVNPQPTGNQ